MNRRGFLKFIGAALGAAAIPAASPLFETLPSVSATLRLAEDAWISSFTVGLIFWTAGGSMLAELYIPAHENVSLEWNGKYVTLRSGKRKLLELFSVVDADEASMTVRRGGKLYGVRMDKGMAEPVVVPYEAA